jgi:CheY-like chemotaxis protein
MKNYLKKNVLVVEDEEVTYYFINKMLTQNDANVFRATNGLEAINMIISKANIDLILMDIQLPELNGWETIVEIKKINGNIPIIIQTAYSSKKQKDRCTELGCTGYITKQYNFSELILLIKEYL